MRRAKMSLYDLVLAALLLGIGLILHAVFPGIFAGMKPDFSLIMLFVILMLTADKRVGFIAGIATGIITALTTTFPMGEIPNVIDKLVTTAAVLAMLRIVPKKVLVPVVGVVGTLVSGITFLTSAAVIAELPASFTSLMGMVVLPAAAINTVGLFLLYPIAAKLYAINKAGSRITTAPTEK